MRDQFLVEIDTGTNDSGTGCQSLAELNRLFTAWCHQQYHRATHSETGATPAQRYHADGRDRAPRPDPTLLRRAFLWREQRKVTTFATISLHGNRYQVDAALVGRTVDLLFTPFDLTIIEVEYQGRPMGRAIPHQVTRHVHPAVKPDAPTPAQPTGIDYLQLLQDAHHRKAVGQMINFDALQGPAEHPGNPQDGPGQDGPGQDGPGQA